MNIAILWDFDGTLGYIGKNWPELLADAMGDSGIELKEPRSMMALFYAGVPSTLHEISHSELFRGRDWWSYMLELIAKAAAAGGALSYNQNPERFNRCAERLRENYLGNFGYTLYDDTLDALNLARDRGVKQFMLSNHIPELPLILKKVGIDGFFEEIFCSALIGYEKPNPAIFAYALNRIPDGAEPIMIGDNPIADGEGARRSGIRPVLIRSGAPEAEIDAVGAIESLLISLHGTA